MREIKFRIWHKNEKRWLDPWAEEDPMLSLKDCGEGCEVFLYERDSGDWSNQNCLMKDVVIQQYTGLKDKNGKDIYEGDIIRVIDPSVTTSYWYNSTKVVNYDPHSCFFCLIDLDDWPDIMYNGEMFNQAGEGNNFSDRIEVVENIFERVDK